MAGEDDRTREILSSLEKRFEAGSHVRGANLFEAYYHFVPSRVLENVVQIFCGAQMSEKPATSISDGSF